MLIFHRLFAVALLMLSVPPQSVAAPSYEQTVQFIQSKLNTDYNTEDGYVTSRFTDIERCYFSYAVSFFKNRGSSNPYRWSIVKFNAKDLHKELITVRKSPSGNTNLSLKTFNGQKKVTIISGSSEVRSSLVQISRIRSPSELNAPKVAKAFVRVMELCGAKDELF